LIKFKRWGKNGRNPKKIRRRNGNCARQKRESVSETTWGEEKTWSGASFGKDAPEKMGVETLRKKKKK